MKNIRSPFKIRLNLFLCNRIYERKEMKSMKVTLPTLFIIVALMSACGEKQNDDTSLLKKCPVVAERIIRAAGDTLVVCNPSLLKDTMDFPLSMLLSSFELVKLEDSEEALVKESSGAVAVSDHYVGIYSGTGYKLFDKAGNRIADLSSRGQGPDEYVFSIYDSYIDEKNDRVYLLPMNGDRLLTYDLKGNAQAQIPLAYATGKGKFRVDAGSGWIYVANMAFEATKIAFWIQDFEGNVIREIPAGHLAIVPADFSNELNVSMNVSAMDYSLFHWMAQNDTLYHYQEADNCLKPSFTVDFGEKPLLHDYIELPGYYVLRLIEVEPSYRYVYGLIDKQTLRGCYIRLKLDMLGNIDAPAWLQFDRGFYNANLYAYYLQEQWAEVGDTSSLLPGVSRFVRELQEMDVEDMNNFVLIGKLKEREDETFEMRDVDCSFLSVVKEENSDKTLAKRSGGQEKGTNEPEDEDDPDKIYTGFVFSHVPMLIGGNDYFRKNNRYKDWDSEDPKEVWVEWVVEKDGTASHVFVKESCGNEKLDEEAVRLIKEARYTVGKLRKNGKEVRVGNMMGPVFFPPK